MTDNTCTQAGHETLLSHLLVYLLEAEFFTCISKHLEIQLLNYNTVNAWLNSRVYIIAYDQMQAQ
jgi:hypothetical protein